jgi:hypothetical protein
MRLSKAESKKRDQDIRQLYEKGLGCRRIATALGLYHPNVYRRAKAMGLIKSSAEALARLTTAPSENAFSRMPNPSNLFRAGVGVAIRWFLERGYMTSIPVEPTHYDLIVESDVGLKKVQVKTTTFRDRSGQWMVRVCRTAYDAKATAKGTAGKRRRKSYTEGQVDLFFVLTGDGSKFLIPLESVGETKTINLGEKYAKFKQADVVELVDTQP